MKVVKCKTNFRRIQETGVYLCTKFRQTDEILRLDRKKCIALFQRRKPALLDKLMPEELPDYNSLKPCRVIDYVPEWKQREAQEEKKCAAPVKDVPSPECAEREHAEESHREPPSIQDPVYDLPDLKAATSGGLGMVEITVVRGDKEDDSPEE